ncbi:hypothetical protein [Isoptericola rhizosphaerae]|uniref:hypothetical protein n=1 Tax=Isoptericola rhizosphaerae TaxID=3377837 RepID=UPI00383BE7A7
MTLRVLDHVALERPGMPLRGDDLEPLGLTAQRVARVSGALSRLVYTRYQRSNPPLGSIEIAGQWHYRMEAPVAEAWRKARDLSASN